MASTIKIKRSAVAGKVPTTTDLDLGELALNTYDGKLYTKKSVSGVESIVDLSSASGGGNAFGTFSVSGQSDVVADSLSDTLTLVAGSGITITTNSATDTITFTATGSAGGIDPVVSGMIF